MSQMWMGNGFNGFLMIRIEIEKKIGFVANLGQNRRRGEEY